MAQATIDVVGRLRGRWQQQWLRASEGSEAERSSMLQIHATLHAASYLYAGAGEQPAGLLADLLAAHDQLGRAASPRLHGELSLTAEVVRGVLPLAEPVGHVLPVIAPPGQAPLKVERSRPGWHLNGTLRDVPWSAEAEHLAVFAIDEGDNDVLVLVPRDTPHVVITPAGSACESADIWFDDVELPTVTHCPGVPGALSDSLTVLALARVIGAVDWLLERPAAHIPRGMAELELCRASLRAAAASLTSPSVVRRQHDVSSATLLVLSTCLRLAEATGSSDDPAARRRVEHVRQRVRALPAWHSDRLHALV